MNLDGIKLTQLRALTAIAKYGNFSEAALSLQVSQSAVSHAIATLEEALGVVLLSRGRYGAVLTPVGERVLSHAQDMLRLVEQIGREANLSKGLQGGQVRVASFRSAATHVLPGVLIEFRKRFPAIAVIISEYQGDDGVEQALREGKADIGILCLSPSEEFETWELMRDEYVVLLPPSAEPSRQPICWQELASYPLILSPPGDSCFTLVRNYMDQQAQTLTPAYQIREDSTIVNMVMQGVGATIMARLAAEPLPPQIQVRHLPAPLERIIRAAILEDALHPPSVFAFLETLKDISRSSCLPHLVQHEPEVAIG